MYKTIFFLVLTMLAGVLHSTETQSFNIQGTEYEYTRPTWKDPFLQITPTLESFFIRSFSKENFFNLGIIAASTMVLYHYDRELYNGAQKFGRNLGIGNKDNTRTMITLSGFNIFRGPTDWGSSLYFLGDGWTHAAILSGFLINGSINDNNRALQTGAELFHGLIINTATNQFLKHITGRESPVLATTTRGKWKPFPNQVEYGKKVPSFDAYPSGHIATSMMTFTVIRNNYPEYDSVLAPIQWTWLSLLGFQMMNNGVHWASDYPLALGMGHLIGQISSEIGRKKSDHNKIKNEIIYTPIFNYDGAPGIGLVFNF